MRIAMRAILDTHAWIWWVTDDSRLSRAAQRAIKGARADRALWLSVYSLWEVAKKVQKGQLVLDRPLDDWLAAATAHGGVRVAELTRDILVESCRLPAAFAGDPADAIIVATARSLGATLVTKDQRLRGYEHVRTAW